MSGEPPSTPAAFSTAFRPSLESGMRAAGWKPIPNLAGGWTDGVRPLPFEEAVLAAIQPAPKRGVMTTEFFTHALGLISVAVLTQPQQALDLLHQLPGPAGSIVSSVGGMLLLAYVTKYKTKREDAKFGTPPPPSQGGQ